MRCYYIYVFVHTYKHRLIHICITIFLHKKINHFLLDAKQKLGQTG